MTVWVVAKGYDYEGEHIEGVYATRKSAQRAAAQLKRRRSLPNSHPDSSLHDTEHVWEFEVQP